MSAKQVMMSPALSWPVFILIAAAVVVACAVFSVILVKKIKAMLKMTR